MTREILFKAKRKDNGEWVEGYVVAYPSGKAEIHKISKELPDILLICEIAQTPSASTQDRDINAVRKFLKMTL